MDEPEWQEQRPTWVDKFKCWLNAIANRSTLQEVGFSWPYPANGRWPCSSPSSSHILFSSSTTPSRPIDTSISSRCRRDTYWPTTPSLQVSSSALSMRRSSNGSINCQRDQLSDGPTLKGYFFFDFMKPILSLLSTLFYPLSKRRISLREPLSNASGAPPVGSKAPLHKMIWLESVNATWISMTSREWGLLRSIHELDFTIVAIQLKMSRTQKQSQTLQIQGW